MHARTLQGVTTGPWFTLHGLWPQDTDGDYPCTCTQEAFDPSILTPIQADMDRYWPSLNGPSNTFWEHEWSKHGTCTPWSVHDYFNHGLQTYYAGEWRQYCSEYETNCKVHVTVSADKKKLTVSKFNKAKALKIAGKH